jgi:hypothetical protein
MFLSCPALIIKSLVTLHVGDCTIWQKNPARTLAGDDDYDSLDSDAV